MTTATDGYLESFENDIFVSYAHVDNLPDNEGDKGWVEEFSHRLSLRLLKRRRSQVDPLVPQSY